MLTTARLVLRRREPADAPVVRLLWEERDPRVPAARRIGSDGRPTVQDLEDRLADEASRSGPQLLTVTVRATGAVIGYCGLVAPAAETLPGYELAFELLRSHHGRGYATEAGSAVVLRARETGLDRLCARVRVWNTASRRVLHKLGFREGPRTVDKEHGDSILTELDLT